MRYCHIPIFLQIIQVTPEFYRGIGLSVYSLTEWRYTPTYGGSVEHNTVFTLGRIDTVSHINLVTALVVTEQS